MEIYIHRHSEKRCAGKYVIVCGKVLCVYTHIVYVFDVPLMKVVDSA